jgi:hypothetical protein
VPFFFEPDLGRGRAVGECEQQGWEGKARVRGGGVWGVLVGKVRGISMAAVRVVVVVRDGLAWQLTGLRVGALTQFHIPSPASAPPETHIYVFHKEYSRLCDALPLDLIIHQNAGTQPTRLRILLDCSPHANIPFFSL